MEKCKSIKVNAILNMTKQLCMIFFPMITFPFASRVLGTYYYGKINFGTSIISYITLIAGLGISNYAIREGSKLRDDKNKLQRFCNEIFSINVCSTLASYILLIGLLLCWKKIKSYTALLLIQGLAVFFTTLGTDWINSIFEDYLFITIRYIICQTVSIILMLTIVNSQNDYLIYALISVSSTIFSNIGNIIHIRKRYSLRIKFIFDMNYRQHMKPIIVLFGTALATSIYINSDTTILGVFKDENSVGLYSVASKIYLLIKQMLNAMLIVVVPQISNEVAKGEWSVINKRLQDICGNLIVIVGPAMIGLFMLSRNIVFLFSGNDYLQAAETLRILSVSIIPATLACFLINVVLIPFGKENIVLVATIISAVTNIILNFVLIPYWGQNAAAVTTLIAEFVMMSFGLFFSRKLIYVKLKKNIIISCISSLSTFFLCWCVQILNLGNFITILISFLSSILLCALIFFLFNRETLNNYIDFINRYAKNK